MLAAWLAQAFAANNPLDADAVSYLDIAYSCLSGNWHALVHGYWSPGYPFLLALWLRLFQVGPYHEPLAVHMLTVVSLMVALASFEFFLSAYFDAEKKLRDNVVAEQKGFLAEKDLRLLGYALFVWITTFLTPPHLEQPDIFVFILYLIAAGLCLRVVSSTNKWWRYPLLGGVLGIAYLVKAVMFPLAFTFIVALLLRKEWKRALPGVALTAVVFAAVSAPFVFELSKSKGRLTYGDVGAVNYLHIMGMDQQAETDAKPDGVHALARPSTTPHIQSYANTVSLGTYPPWADPSYRYSDGPLRFDLRRQLNRTHVVLRYYFDLYVVSLAPLTTGVLIFVGMGGSVREFLRRLLRAPVLWFPALSGLALYALVRAEGRMLAGFTVAFFFACFAATRIDDTDSARRFSRIVAVVVSVVLIGQAVIMAGHEVFKSRRANYPDWQVASALREMGVEPDARVSYMGYGLTDHAWAHLARVRISAEISAEDMSSFWAADQEQRAEVEKWLAATGARVLVTREVPETAVFMGWKKVGDTEYFILPLPRD
jgi:hypothetical protein